jgi:hypothetical protein
MAPRLQTEKISSKKTFQNSQHISHKDRRMNPVQDRRYIRDFVADIISKFSLAPVC